MNKCTKSSAVRAGWFIGLWITSLLGFVGFVYLVKFCMFLLLP